MFTSSSKTLFSKVTAVVREKHKIRKFIPELIKGKSEIRSVLEFPLTAEDHGATYKCRTFAEATMSMPQESALKATFNVTCKLFNLYLNTPTDCQFEFLSIQNNTKKSFKKR